MNIGIKTTALALVAMTIGMAAEAKITVTRLTANRQHTPVAIVDGSGGVQLSWRMESDIQNDRPTAYRLVVTNRLTGRKVKDTGKVATAGSSMACTLPGGSAPAGYSWRVMVWDAKGKPSPWSREQTLRRVPQQWRAPWVGAITRRDARLPEGRWANSVFKKDTFKTKWANADTLSGKSITMRRQFSTEGKRRIIDAVAYVSGMGHYEMMINGQRVSDAIFAPLWSEYDKTVYYNMHDVTPLIAKGSNAVSLTLGNGFFNVQRMGRYSKLQTSFGVPQATMMLVITYADGRQQTITTDTQWRWHTNGITFNSIYGGESFNASLHPWQSSTVGFDDSRWRPVVVTEGPRGKLTPQLAPPVKIMERHGVKQWQYIPADSLAAASKRTKRTVSPGAWLADMGQNLAGFPEISVVGQKGQTITLIPAETLTPQGAADQRQTGRQHYYEYTIGQSGQLETWHPQFSYYGFRYMQVEGAVMDGEPNPRNLPVIKTLNSCFIHSSAQEVSAFECSNPILNGAHRLIERAERSNMQSVLTDCPHREKLGWLEQDHLCGPSLLYNYDMTTYVPKVIGDICDTQKANGMVPTTAPQYVSFGNLFDDSPEWGSTLAVLPFQYYSMYGDSTLITRHYQAMSRYADYLTQRADKGIVSHGLGDWYDYGPWRAGFSRNTPVPLVATAHYIINLRLVARAAAMTGRKADARRYALLEQDVVKAFNDTFFRPDSMTYGSGSQCSMALPLYLGIAGEHKQAVLKSLVDDIRRHGTRLTTGDVGNRYLFRVLADNGLNDLLYEMLNHYDTPGYGFQLKQGATTLTEQWDPRQGTSQNHFMMGQIDEWLFRSLAGIRPTDREAVQQGCTMVADGTQTGGMTGDTHITIAPTLPGDLTYVKAHTELTCGRVAVYCDRHTLRATIPMGCTATIITPTGTSCERGAGTWEISY